MILGIDEVGRGPWAGPVVIGAVVLPEGETIEGLTDSKKISAKKRVALDAQIKEIALGWGLGWVDAAEIDEIGLSAALRLATVRAVQAINTPYHEIIIDGTINFLSDTPKGRYVKTMPKADFLIPAVSAASIIAKVARDSFMEEQDSIYPGYGFKSHVGYGTAKHASALSHLGVSPLHRKSFAPIAKLINAELTAVNSSASVYTSKSIGDRAERLVAQYIISKGYEVIERNWKTKYCEIDIIAETATTRYFIEVKYRSTENQGGGSAAITPAKLRQMKFAAEQYSQQHLTDKDQLLIAAIVKKDNTIDLLEIS